MLEDLLGLFQNLGLRFSARRGKPTTIFSDNGTNFVGAKRKLNELGMFLRNHDHRQAVTAFASESDIEWKFIPPQAPHFGGLWEAAVKSVKHHLRRVIGAHLLSYEEFYTLLTQVEAAIIGRP
ncbi:hypothetical protein, partial [Klebsiella pneumoniae]|uniref:hypothetical protein n=1 Tax=Klebsiella pneumoniae TaxID=573 RepID=UPI0040554A61